MSRIKEALSGYVQRLQPPVSGVAPLPPDSEIDQSKRDFLKLVGLSAVGALTGIGGGPLLTGCSSGDSSPDFSKVGLKTGSKEESTAKKEPLSKVEKDLMQLGYDTIIFLLSVPKNYQLDPKKLMRIEPISLQGPPKGSDEPYKVKWVYQESTPYNIADFVATLGEAEVKNIKVDSVQSLPLTPADQANGLIVKGRINASFISRHRLGQVFLLDAEKPDEWLDVNAPPQRWATEAVWQRENPKWPSLTRPMTSWQDGRLSFLIFQKRYSAKDISWEDDGKVVIFPVTRFSIGYKEDCRANPPEGCEAVRVIMKNRR